MIGRKQRKMKPLDSNFYVILQNYFSDEKKILHLGILKSIYLIYGQRNLQQIYFGNESDKQETMLLEER